MVLKYYYDLLSQPCRAIYIFLKLTKIPYEDHPISLMAGEQNKGEFSKKNAMQRVPLIEDDGFVLSESVAILKYLALKYKVSDNWYPRDDVTQQAIADEVLNWQHIQLRLQAAKVFLNIFLFPKRTGKPVDWTEVETYRAGVTKAMNELENYFLKGKQFVAGNDISIADLLCVCELTQLLPVSEENLYESNQVVNAWVQRVKEKSSSVFADAHKNLLGLKQGFEKPAQPK